MGTWMSQERNARPPHWGCLCALPPTRLPGRTPAGLRTVLRANSDSGCPSQISPLVLTAAILCGFPETHSESILRGLNTAFRKSRDESEPLAFCPCGLADFFPGSWQHGWWHKSKTPKFTVNFKIRKPQCSLESSQRNAPVH